MGAERLHARARRLEGTGVIVIDCGTALAHQRDEIIGDSGRIQFLSSLVNASADLNIGQWAQLYAMALEFRPDLILDLGRGHGNSTCLFTEAAHKLGASRVVSIGFRDDHAWAARTEPALRNALPTGWFEPLTIIDQDVKRIDCSVLYGEASSVLVFWDMLGYGVTRHILDHVLPPLASREHLVIVKDVTDGRYHAVDGAYRSAGLLSTCSEVGALGAFLLRNEITYQTAEHSMRVWRDNHPEESAALESAWSADAPKPGPLEASDWIYFQLPDVVRPTPGIVQRLRDLVEPRR
jgi:hypothetical protein